MPAMPPAIRKRSFAASSVGDDDGNLDQTLIHNRARRQRTSSTSSVETIRSSNLNPPSKPRTLSVQESRPTGQENQLPQSKIPTPPKSGFSSAKSLAIAALKPQSLNVTQRPTRIPVKANLRRETAGSSIVINSLEPLPPAATPVHIIASSPADAQLRTTLAQDEALVAAVFDMRPTAVVVPKKATPQPPPPQFSTSSSPPQRVRKTAGSSPPSKLLPTSRPSAAAALKSTQVGSVAFPTKQILAALVSDRPAPVGAPKKNLARKDPPAPSIYQQLFGMDPGVSEHFRDEYGCVHLGAPDCELFISFADSPHCEIWDMEDDAEAACAAYLYIMTRDPARWDGIPLSIPDVSQIDIQVRPKPVASRFTGHEQPWSTSFTGAELPSSSVPTAPTAPLDSIAIENRWDRVFSPPRVGKAGQLVSSSSSDSDAQTEMIESVTTTSSPTPSSSSSSSSPSSSRPSSASGSSSPATTTDTATVSSRLMPGRGWAMRFWIPIPSHLFLKKETRVFEISAKVWLTPTLNGRKPTLTPASSAAAAWNGASTVKVPGCQELGSNGPEPSSVDQGATTGFMIASAEMTVSHLRKEREMM